MRKQQPDMNFIQTNQEAFFYKRKELWTAVQPSKAQTYNHSLLSNIISIHPIYSSKFLYLSSICGSLSFTAANLGPHTAPNP